MLFSMGDSAGILEFTVRCGSFIDFMLPYHILVCIYDLLLESNRTYAGLQRYDHK